MIAALLVLTSALAAPPKPVRVPGQAKPPVQRVERSAHITSMGDPGIRRGFERLRTGQYQLALDRFQVELEADPSSVPAQRGVALAYAAKRDCDQAFPRLMALRADAHWDVDLAVAEGNCALRTGDLSRAVVAFDEAVMLDPSDADAWYGLASSELEVGDSEAAEAALDGLRDTEWKTTRAPVMAATVEAWAARAAGGQAAWDALYELRAVIQEHTGEARAASMDADTIEGELWLDLGNPVLAEQAFANGTFKSLRAPRTGALRAEATRRMGDLAEAERLLVEGRARRGEHVIKDVVMARILVDKREFADAEKAIALLPMDDLDAAATRWYFDRARQAPVTMLAADEARWHRLGPSPEASLDQLVPWTAP